MSKVRYTIVPENFFCIFSSIVFCSSVVGMLDLSKYINSDLNNPIELRNGWSKEFISSLEPTFTLNSRSEASYISCVNALTISSCNFDLSFISLIVSSSGLIFISPVSPSIEITSLFLILFISSPIPMMHGIPRFLATITACDVVPPSLRIIPFI